MILKDVLTEHPILFFPFLIQEMELPMLKVSAPELVSGVSGESEQKMRELFELAVVRKDITSPI